MGAENSKDKSFEFSNPNLGNSKQSYPAFDDAVSPAQYDTPSGTKVNVSHQYNTNANASTFQPPILHAAESQSFSLDDEGHNDPVVSQAPKDSGYLAIDPQWLQEQFKLMTGLPWFTGRQNRLDANKELANKPPGSFVVRVSSQPGHYAISVQLGYKIESMLCLPSWDPTRKASGETVYRLGSQSKKTFESIPALVDYYTQHPFYRDPYGVKHFFKYPGSIQVMSDSNRTPGYMELSPGDTETNTDDLLDYDEREEAMNHSYEAADASLVAQVRARNNNQQQSSYDAADPVLVSHAKARDQETKRKISKEVGYIEIAADTTNDDDDDDKNDYEGGEPATQHFDNSNPFAAPPTQSYTPSSKPSDKFTTSRGQELTPSELKVYQAYFDEADPAGEGMVTAGNAVKFFATSGLSNATLKIIWSLADDEKRGYLDRDGFFIALKLVALKQVELPLSLDNINDASPLPNFE